MNIKWGLFSLIVIAGLLLVNYTLSGLQPYKRIKAYLILNNQSKIIKNDSLFEKNIRSRLTGLLKKKNITLISNKETETADQEYLYIKIVINDSLRISEWKNIAPQSNSTIHVLPKNNVFEYNDEKEIIKKIIYTVKIIF
jgi:hypothetical protein